MASCWVALRVLCRCDAPKKGAVWMRCGLEDGLVIGTGGEMVRFEAWWFESWQYEYHPSTMAFVCSL